MYSLGYSFSQSINLYKEAIGNYSTFYTIVIVSVILGIVFITNLNGKNNVTLTAIIDTICIFFTLYHFGLEIIDHLDSCWGHDFMNNICLYFLNANIALIVLGIIFSGSLLDYYSRFTLMILYLLNLGNLAFALFVSYSVNENIFITVGNIAPMIHIGNFLAFLSYIVVIVLSCTNRICKYCVDKKHLLYK